MKTVKFDNGLFSGAVTRFDKSGAYTHITMKREVMPCDYTLSQATISTDSNLSVWATFEVNPGKELAELLKALGWSPSDIVGVRLPISEDVKMKGVRSESLRKKRKEEAVERLKEKMKNPPVPSSFCYLKDRCEQLRNEYVQMVKGLLSNEENWNLSSLSPLEKRKEELLNELDSVNKAIETQRTSAMVNQWKTIDADLPVELAQLVKSGKLRGEARRSMRIF